MSRHTGRTAHRMRESWKFPIGVIGLSVALSGVTAISMRAQNETDRDVTSGVFTRDQAAAGKQLYRDLCSSCHLENLSGDTSAPPMVGDEFIANWENKPLRALYSRIISTMPSDNPGTLSEKTVVDLVAYLLEVNGFPPGSRALEKADELNTITVKRAKQP
jgi:mono/diheme cytochrome c family protein